MVRGWVAGTDASQAIPSKASCPGLCGHLQLTTRARRLQRQWGGIYLFEMDPATGALTQREVFPDGSNPSWLALHPSQRFLYAAHEVGRPGTQDSGAVAAFSVDRSSGHLTKLNTVSSQGAGPAHLSVHPSGQY